MEDIVAKRPNRNESSFAAKCKKSNRNPLSRRSSSDSKLDFRRSGLMLKDEIEQHQINVDLKKQNSLIQDKISFGDVESNNQSENKSNKQKPNSESQNQDSIDTFNLNL